MLIKGPCPVMVNIPPRLATRFLGEAQALKQDQLTVKPAKCSLPWHQLARVVILIPIAKALAPKPNYLLIFLAPPAALVEQVSYSTLRRWPVSSSSSVQRLRCEASWTRAGFWRASSRGHRTVPRPFPAHLKTPSRLDSGETNFVLGHFPYGTYTIWNDVDFVYKLCFIFSGCGIAAFLTGVGSSLRGGRSGSASLATGFTLPWPVSADCCLCLWWCWKRMRITDVSWQITTVNLMDRFPSLMTR